MAIGVWKSRLGYKRTACLEFVLSMVPKNAVTLLFGNFIGFIRAVVSMKPCRVIIVTLVKERIRDT